MEELNGLTLQIKFYMVMQYLVCLAACHTLTLSLPPFPFLPPSVSFRSLSTLSASAQTSFRFGYLWSVCDLFLYICEASLAKQTNTPNRRTSAKIKMRKKNPRFCV